MKKIILFLFLCSVMTGGFLYYCRNGNQELSTNESRIKSNDSINMEEIEDESNDKIDENNTSGVEDNNYSIHNSNENDMESNNASNSNVIKEEKKETKTSTQTVSKSKEENKTEDKENNNEENTAVNKEDPKKQTPWEVLGVSEYHYYNEPMYSWEKVDFPVSKYGSETNCRKACAEYGDNYEPYLNGEVLYSCSIVTSLSGKYLGEYFSTEKLN